MKQQVSAGAVIFRRDPDGQIRFLLLYKGRNYWNSPKGKIEGGERAIAAFFREVEEETGLRQHDLRLVPSFREANRYTFSVAEPTGGRHQDPKTAMRHIIHKTDLFYLAEALRYDIALSSEHRGFGWFTYPEALHVLKHPSIRELIKKAYAVIRYNLSRHPAHPQRQGRDVRRHRPSDRPSTGVAPRRHGPFPEPRP